MTAPARHETTLHLLFTRPGQAAVHAVPTDHLTYFGADVTTSARAAGVPGHLLRRVHFRHLGEVDGVRRAECAWHLHPEDGAVPDWRPDDAWDEPIRGWIAAARTPPTNVPWMHPGWHADALAWVDAELAAQGRARTGGPAVLKHWQISALWRVPTDSGPVYFKAVPEFFAREVEVTPVLARELPGAAPRVLAADTPRGLLLLDDAGDEFAGTTDFPALMVHVARLQQASVSVLPGLTLRDRGPEYVRRWLEALCSDDVLLTGQEGGFTPEEAGQLRTRRPALDAALARLSSSPLPRTLGHGDLHGGNVTTRSGHHTLLDWSDVCVTHPFLDVNPAYFAPWQVDAPQHALDAARDAYLAQWSHVAPPDDLRALYEDALVCGELFRALGYVDGLQGAVEDKSEWRTGHIGHLHRVLSLTAGQAWAWTP